MILMRSTLVLSKYLGGLGNRLILHIHVMAFAMEHGFSLVNLTLHRDAHLFAGLWANSWCRYPPPAFGLPLHQLVRGARFWAEYFALRQIRRPGAVPGLHTWMLGADKSVSMESPRFAAVCRGHRWINLQGWLFRAPHYVRKHREAIRKIMRFRRSVNPELASRLDQTKSPGRTRICLHIRQGDYRAWEGGRHYVDPGEYAQAACRIAQRESRRNPEFWLCSDEPVDLTLFPPGTRICPHRSLSEDFQVMTESDFILGGISTFSRAAAFLGGAKIHFHVRGRKIPPLHAWGSGSNAINE